jgi:F-type H+-transporting ATPase subunit b
MISIATMMAEKMVSVSVDAEIQERLIEDTLKEMGENTWQS